MKIQQRNKLKSIKLGFTLIELMGVITILGIMVLIAIPAVKTSISSSKDALYESQIINIKDALKSWAVDNSKLLPEEEGQTIIITLGQLKTGGYIDSELINPKSNRCIGNDMLLTITRYQKNYIYEVNEETGTETDVCESHIRPYIILNGDAITYVEYGEEYVDLGVTAKDELGNDITGGVTSTITGSGTSVDTSVIGNKYTITYTVTSDNVTESINRTVIVRDSIKPELTIPSNVLLDPKVTNYDVVEGVSTTDNSGEVLISVKSNISFGIPGRYTITYTATDSSGNKTIKKRLVTIENRTHMYITNLYNVSEIDKETIQNIYFVREKRNGDAIDVSVDKDETVLLYLEGNGNTINEKSMYDAYIYSRLTVSAPVDSSNFFRDLTYLDSIDFNDMFDTSNVELMNYMFSGASNLTSLDLSSFDTSNVTNMSFMFYELAKLTSLNLSSFNTENVENMSNMFQGLLYLNNLDLSNFNTAKVKDMSGMFFATGRNSTGFTLNLGDNFNTINVKDMRRMFFAVGKNNSKFTLDLGDKFDTRNVKIMVEMFYYTGYNSTTFTLDLGENFDTKNAEDMSSMFNRAGSYSTTTTINLGNKFNTSKVTNMDNMFEKVARNNSNWTLDLGDEFVFNENVSVASFASECGAGKLVLPKTVTNIPSGAFKGMTKLSEIVFEHTSTDSIALPTPGSSTGAFYTSSSINTTVTTTNDTIKNYGWASDNRIVTFN